MHRLDYAALAAELRARVDAELAPPARASIADLQQFVADGSPPLTPEQRAAYEHRVYHYRRSSRQDELPFEESPSA